MGFFRKCHYFVVRGGRFEDNSVHITKPVNVIVHSEAPFPKGKGIDALRGASMLEAIHDSGARDPPRCFPGTREEHIRNITSWGAGNWQTKARVLWLKGPAGVGKSAVAQTCAESERVKDRFGASFFFSRPNNRNNPAQFVPTIAYQLSTKSQAYRDLIDAKIAHDPSILEKSIDVQFRELLVEPLEQLKSRDHGLSDKVIIIDGLDECDGRDAQRVIIEVVTTSVLQQSTPFLWAFFSRPEPHIVAAFSEDQIREICWKLTLPVSRDADKDIEAYLRDGFGTIRTKYNIPATIPWPSEEDIQQLVHQSAGLFIYPASAIRFILHSPGPYGPERQLRLVLEVERTRSNSRSANPLSNLDQFYILVMRQIPEEILHTTLLLLLIHFHHVGDDDYLPKYCAILNFSPTTVYAALSDLHSVLEVKETRSGVPSHLSFYHASFSDFLCDITRSTAEFCVETQHTYSQFYSACIDVLCHSPTTGPSGCRIDTLAQWASSQQKLKDQIYSIAVWHCFKFMGSTDLEADVLQQFSCLNWSLVVEFCNEFRYDLEAFVEKIPQMWRPKVIHSSECRSSTGPVFTAQQGGLLNAPEKMYSIRGNGDKMTLVVRDEVVPLPTSSAHTRCPTDALPQSSRITRLLGMLTQVLENEERRKTLWCLEGDRAQLIIDYLCSVLIRSEPAAPSFRKLVLQVLRRLSETSTLYPRCYVLEGIAFDHRQPVSTGGFCNIYQGRYGRQSLCLKRAWVSATSGRENIQLIGKEAVLWGQLHHPSITPFYGVYYLDGTMSGDICLVSPRMTNGNLVEYLRVNPLVCRKSLIYDVACGLDYLHSEGIIHGDLKGMNILVNESGRACITDFGLSTVCDGIIAPGKVVGISFRWAAPELLDEGSHPNIMSDVWAFGMVCYEVMTRRIPFYDCMSDPLVIRRLLKGVLPTRPLGKPELDIDQIDDAMWDLMVSCWTQEPENRPTCAQILQSPEFVRLKNGYEDKAEDRLVHDEWRRAMLQRAQAFANLDRVEEILHELLQL